MPPATKTTGPAGGGPKPLPSGPQTESRSPGRRRDERGRPSTDHQVDDVERDRGAGRIADHVVQGQRRPSSGSLAPASPGRIITNWPGRIAPAIAGSPSLSRYVSRAIGTFSRIGASLTIG